MCTCDHMEAGVLITFSDISSSFSLLCCRSSGHVLVLYRCYSKPNLWNRSIFQFSFHLLHAETWIESPILEIIFREVIAAYRAIVTWPMPVCPCELHLWRPNFPQIFIFWKTMEAHIVLWGPTATRHNTPIWHCDGNHNPKSIIQIKSSREQTQYFSRRWL